MHHVDRLVPREEPPCGSRRHLDEPCVPPVRHDYLLCETCLDGVENTLVDVPDWYAQRVRRARELGKPLRADVVRVASDIVDALSSWCALVVAQRGVLAPEPPSITLLTGFLAVHLQWLATRPTAAEFADDLMVVGEAVRRVVRPESALPASLGPCPWPGCGEQLYATADEPAAAQRISCVAGHRWPPDQWLTLSRELTGMEQRGDDPDVADGGAEQMP